MIIDHTTTSLLQQAAEWRMLGLLFECPGPAWRKHVAALARDIADPTLQSTALAALDEAAEGDFHSIFGPGGPAPAREVSYHESLQLGYLISELTAFYSAFAYHPVTEEPLDHVSLEAGFIGYLRLKEAFAVANADPDAASVAREAASSFINDHLSCLAGPLAKSLSNSGINYLAAAGQALLARVGPPRSLPVIQSLAPVPDCVDSAFDCGIA